LLAIWFRAFDDGIIFDTTAIAIKQLAAMLNDLSFICLILFHSQPKIHLRIPVIGMICVSPIRFSRTDSHTYSLFDILLFLIKHTCRYGIPLGHRYLVDLLGWENLVLCGIPSSIQRRRVG